jgi:hypothetical protein
MQFDPTDMVSAINRIKRAQGQLGGVLRMLGEGRDCEDILTPSLPPSSVHSIAPGPPSCQPGSSNGQWRRHRPHRHQEDGEALFLSLAQSVPPAEVDPQHQASPTGGRLSPDG